MCLLRSSKVLRKPSTGGSRTWKRADGFGGELRLETRYSNTNERDLRLSFTVSASGGSVDTPGNTNIRVLVDTKDYADILKAMCDVDREAAMAAMSAELARQLSVDAGDS